MVSNTIAEDHSSEYEYQKALSLYMVILHNFRGLVDIYLHMMNVILLAKMGKRFSATIPLT